MGSSTLRHIQRQKHLRGYLVLLVPRQHPAEYPFALSFWRSSPKRPYGKGFDSIGKATAFPSRAKAQEAIDGLRRDESRAKPYIVLIKHYCVLVPDVDSHGKIYYHALPKSYVEPVKARADKLLAQAAGFERQAKINTRWAKKLQRAARVIVTAPDAL